MLLLSYHQTVVNLKESQMKVKVPALFALLLALAVGALAATRNSANLSLTEPVTVSGTQLPAGDYQVRWEGDNESVQVSFVQDKKVVATAPASLVQRKADYNGAIET